MRNFISFILIAFIVILVALRVSYDNGDTNEPQYEYPVHVFDGRTYYYYNGLSDYSFMSPTYETLVAAAEEAYWNVEKQKAEAPEILKENLQKLNEVLIEQRSLLDKLKLYDER